MNRTEGIVGGGERGGGGGGGEGGGGDAEEGLSECRGRWVLIRDRRTDLRYYVFSRASVINVSNTPRGSSPQTPRLLAHRRQCGTRVFRRYLNFPANDTDVNDQASRNARSSRTYIESERSTKAKRIQWPSSFRPCNPVNVRQIARDTDRVRSVPSYGHTQRCIASYRMSSPFVRNAANETHSFGGK